MGFESGAGVLTSDLHRPFLPFAVPDISEAEIHEVLDTLRSGWLTTGPRTRQFESEFAALLGGGVHAMAISSATAGLHLALEAIGLGPNDEVIVPTYTFTATAEVVRYLGAHPVLVDCDAATLNITGDLIEPAITSRTRAIIPVHFGGLACDMDPILALAARHGLKVVEDAAHAIPATYRGTLVGALGSDATAFSFYATKTVAVGEGGMLVTRNDAIAERCRIMRLHGISHDAFDRYTSDRPSWEYDVVAPGFKYNMPDLAAAVGLAQLRRQHELWQRRLELAANYSAAFADLPCVLPAPAPAGEKHAWHLYPIRLTDDAPIGRNRFIERLAELGIGCSVHFIPLHMLTYWRETYRLDTHRFPNATDAFGRVVSLPLYSRMDEADQDRVIEAVRSLLV